MPFKRSQLKKTTTKQCILQKTNGVVVVERAGATEQGGDWEVDEEVETQ